MCLNSGGSHRHVEYPRTSTLLLYINIIIEFYYRAMRYDRSVIGKAYVRTICVPSSSVGIIAVSRTYLVFSISLGYCIYCKKPW